MKNRLINTLILFVALNVSSCNYLDFDETSGLYTREDMYEYFSTMQQMLTNVYSYMPQDFGTIDGAMRDCGSDDAEFGNTGATVQRYNNGTWSQINTIDVSWTLYNGIRAANEFLESFEDVDYSRYENESSYANWLAQMAYHPYEARVLRAHYLFELARRYGDIPMPLTMLSAEEANSIEKTPFEDVIDFIVSECDECSLELPLTYSSVTGSQTGRITKGFAMAVKSKALLYAASELHNSTMDQDKWERSAQAALDLLTLSATEGGSSYYKLDSSDVANNVSSSEAVLFRMNTDSWSFEQYNFPIRFTEGYRTSLGYTTFPTQNLVDAFQTINGYDVTLDGSLWLCDDPYFNSQAPYDNRDPRFARAILCNGMEFKGETIELFAGGLDDVSVSEGGSPTGYFLRRYIQEETSFTTGSTAQKKHHWIVYRFAETWLTYAESMIEAFGDPTYSDNTYTISALEAINTIRDNAGMPNITTTDKDEFIEALRREWRVEFAFEDHRFWDIRRWMIGEETQKEIYGVYIEKVDNLLTFRRDLYENRTWNSKMNLYPIPQSELFLNSNLAPQNTGW
ncbi:MAG: RagB/SusD family nutrient uptake outer membrane protein [Rikenellaceae bacterium]